MLLDPKRRKSTEPCLGESQPETVRERAKTSVGVADSGTDSQLANRKSNGRSTVLVKPILGLNGHGGSEGERSAETERSHTFTCRQIQALQKEKVFLLGVRLILDSKLGSYVARLLGDSQELAEADRIVLRRQAEQLIVSIEKGKAVNHEEIARRISLLVTTNRVNRNGFNILLRETEKKMCSLAETLGPAEWVKGIRGVGILSLATIVGEAGDLSNYPNPGKLWRRLGLAPYNGKMGSTWRKGFEGKLTAEQWTDFGYSPRRRSASWMIGKAIMMQNKGTYRARFEEAKSKSKANEQHSDWSDGRHNNHAMLLATKRFVLDLWKKWNE